jgi:hypothetical protein
MFTFKQFMANQRLGRKFMIVGTLIGILISVLTWQPEHAENNRVE